MARVGLDKKAVIEKAAQLANETGFENLSLKVLAKELNIQSPSLYNHIGGLEELKQELMIYGWNQLEGIIINAITGKDGYEAIEELCRTFYKYATNNAGVFNAMLWYNKFQSNDTLNATDRLFDVIFKILSPMNISNENINHLIRTFRGFIEGFALLVNNNAFGNPISIEESFDLSMKVLIEGVKSLEEKR